MLLKAKRNETICERCLIPECNVLVACPVGFRKADCVGCGACALACPLEAVTMIETAEEGDVTVRVDGKNVSVPKNGSVKGALEGLGIQFGKFPNGISAPCETGGCYTCALEIDGEVRQCCIAKVREGMTISTDLPEDHVPRRIVGGFMGHEVGGVGTPWNLKASGVIEVALFTAGCNFRCSQCQNWTIAYRGKESFDYRALTPGEAAEKLTRSRRKYRVDRMAISGGESTLNPGWLIGCLKALKTLNPGPEARFHVDTNGSLLTPRYIDELVDAGMSDVGIDIKAWNTETFMKICGLTDWKLAIRYKETAWQAVRYLRKHYRDRVFLGIGVPNNEKFTSLEEIARVGREISAIDPDIQVCALDYRPEFRSRHIPQPSYLEMTEVYEVLKEAGLTTVLCQTIYGHIGP